MFLVENNSIIFVYNKIIIIRTDMTKEIKITRVTIISSLKNVPFGAMAQTTAMNWCALTL